MTNRDTSSSGELGALSFRERRQIVKAVNRGRTLDDPGKAHLAVSVARSQMRFWRWSWLLGPVVALIQIGEGVEVFLVNAVFATLILGGLSLFFYRRAGRAETRHLEILADRGRGKPKAERQVGAPPPPEKDEAFRPDPNTSKRKLQRRKKRRR